MFAAAAALDVLGDRHWQAVRVCVDVIERKWQEPDAGIWELDDDVYTHSRLACVAGLRTMALHTDPAEARLWTDLAAQILDHTATTSVAETGYWQQSPNQARVDASLLRPLAQALRAVGNVPRAVHFFERARAACTNSGLFTEEYDTTQHQLRETSPKRSSTRSSSKPPRR